MESKEKEKNKATNVNYPDYLYLDKILNAQYLKSEDHGKPAHDEMLFIIIHQVYELWFKQIIHELDSVMEMFKTDKVDEKSLGIAVARMDRIREIQRILIDQVRVLETMTALDFLDFRKYLVPASGFQSAQFRMLEIKLGLKPVHRITYADKNYAQALSEKEKTIVGKTEAEPSMLDLIQIWLERTPFLDYAGFDFIKEYKKAVNNMLKEEIISLKDNDLITEEEKPRRVKMIEEEIKYFESMFDEQKHNELVKTGECKLSYKATLAALFINLYRDQPILHLPYKLLANLLDIDQLFTTWRQRHSLMVLRMIGKKVGTGGSSGHDYLKATAEKHKIFMDLFNLSTLLIPRSDLPDLPEELIKKLGFYYTAHKN